MTAAALVCAALAALLHVYIWLLESVWWTGPRARRVFGTTPAEAETTRSLALNQGFYNLMLAVQTVAGIVLVTTGWTGAGTALVFAGTGSMLGAAVVLAVSLPERARSAATQGALPLVAVLTLALGLAI